MFIISENTKRKNLLRHNISSVQYEKQILPLKFLIQLFKINISLCTTWNILPDCFLSFQFLIAVIIEVNYILQLVSDIQKYEIWKYIITYKFRVLSYSHNSFQVSVIQIRGLGSYLLEFMAEWKLWTLCNILGRSRNFICSIPTFSKICVLFFIKLGSFLYKFY